MKKKTRQLYMDQYYATILILVTIKYCLAKVSSLAVLTF